MLGQITQLTLTRVAAGALKAETFVTWAGLTASTPDDIIGVVQTDAKINDLIAVSIRGVLTVLAGEALSEGDYVTSNALGLAVKCAKDKAIGRALSAATAVDYQVQILI